MFRCSNFQRSGRLSGFHGANFFVIRKRGRLRHNCRWFVANGFRFATIFCVFRSQGCCFVLVRAVLGTVSWRGWVYKRLDGSRRFILKRIIRVMVVGRLRGSGQVHAFRSGVVRASVYRGRARARGGDRCPGHPPRGGNGSEWGVSV